MSKSLFDLTGKTALVTGGGRGIGLAIARGFAEHGADVALVARTRQQLDSAADRIRSETDRHAWAFCADVGRLEELQGLFEGIVAETGGVDVLVNAAGITHRQAAEDVCREDWNRVLDVNLNAVFVLSQAFCRHRKKIGKPGRIINIGSLLCHGARPSNAPYAASKCGVLAITQMMAVEWAKYGINVNAIGPGYVATELTTALQDDEKWNQWVLSKTPLGRWSVPEDVIGTAVLLASKAGAFITGQIVYVDGGWLAQL